MADVQFGLTSLQSELIEQFRIIAKLYVNKGETYRARAFDRGADAISQIPDQILLYGTKAELMKFPGIGKSIAEEIIKYRTSGSLTERMQAAVIPQTIEPMSEEKQIVELFESIYQVGSVTAKKWYQIGWRTLDDVLLHRDELTVAQRFGIDYYTELSERIPREDIERFEAILKILLSDFEWTIAGSYRRGAASSGDVDILIRPLAHMDIQYAVNILIEAKILITPAGKGTKKYAGIGRIRWTEALTGTGISITFCGKVRRIDIRQISAESWPFALLYFTGSDELNKRMRVRAQEKGWLLNEYGLYQNGQPLSAQSEHEIFTLLDMPYLAPNLRN